jgi:hypothetical protein
LEGQSLRSQARQMEVSHYALHRFLNDRHPIRTRQETIWKIQSIFYWNVSYPPDVVLRWVESKLKRLQPLLRPKDIEELVDSIRQRVTARQEQEAALRRAQEQAAHGYYPFGLS